MIVITKEIFERIIAHCKEDAPNEACGIMAGTGDIIKKIYIIPNADKSHVTYKLDTNAQLKAEKDIRASGMQTIAIYHSHPNTEAYPSQIDIDVASYPEVQLLYPQARYVIVSLENFYKPYIRAFKIIDGEVTEEDIKITE